MFTGRQILKNTLLLTAAALLLRLLSMLFQAYLAGRIGAEGLGGVQLVSIGLIGQYIGKIYVESKHRPRYNPEIFLSDETRAEETK